MLNSRFLICTLKIIDKKNVGIILLIKGSFVADKEEYEATFKGFSPEGTFIQCIIEL